MTSTRENNESDELIPWPKKPNGVRIPVSSFTVRTHMAGLEPNARRAINERCRTLGSNLDRAIKAHWPTNNIPPEWITVQSSETQALAKAVREDIDELTRLDEFQKLRFEGEWFERRTAWETMTWWRKRGSLGALGTILDQAGSSGSPAVQENVPTGFEPPTPVRVQTEDPNAGRVINSDLNRSWVPSRPWER